VAFSNFAGALESRRRCDRLPVGRSQRIVFYQLCLSEFERRKRDQLQRDGVRYSYRDSDGYSDCHGYSYRHSHGYTDTHGNYYAERYSYRYPKADAHPAIRGDAQTPSHTGAATVIRE
jgi:hypothetical protein